MKLNLDKCYLVLSDKDIKTINVGNFAIKSTKNKFIMIKTKSQSHVENLCPKASRKLFTCTHSALYDLKSGR